MEEKRTVTPVRVGNLTLGDGNVYIQSMLSVPSTDIEGNVQQAIMLEQAGCQILRVAIPDQAAVALIPRIKEKISIPLVADIHFDYRLALESLAAGIDKIRINPGNIGAEENVRKVAVACAAKGVPIRIGVNSGSVEKEILAKYGGPVPEALVESGLYHARLLEKYDFNQIVISLKSSDVRTMTAAYRLLAQRCSYPLHLGVTEAGTERMGLIKSSVGIGSLLLDGIGDTLRVSLTGDPVKEVEAGIEILRAAGLRHDGVEIVSCPTCGRTCIPVQQIADRVRRETRGIKRPLKVAVMGCVVNGPGEAREADIGIAGGKDGGALFKKGEKPRTVRGDLADILLDEIHKMLN